MSEKKTENEILFYLNHYGYGMFHKHENQGAVKGRIRVPIRKENKGVSDIIGQSTDGTYCALEVKIEKDYKYIIKNYSELRNGTHTCKRKTHFQEQIRYIEEVKIRGGIAGFVYNIDTAVELLKNI